MSKDFSNDAIAKAMTEARAPTPYMTSQYVLWHLRQALNLLELPAERQITEDVIAAWSKDSCSYKEADILFGRADILYKRAKAAHEELQLTLPAELYWFAHRQRSHAMHGVYGLASDLRGIAAMQIWVDREIEARSIREHTRRSATRRNCLRELKRLKREVDVSISSYCHHVGCSLESWAFTGAYEAASANPSVVFGTRTPYEDERSDALDFAHRISEGTRRQYYLLEAAIRSGFLFDKDHDQLMTALMFGGVLPRPVEAKSASAGKQETAATPVAKPESKPIRESLIRRGRARGELEIERAAAVKALTALTADNREPEFIELREGEIFVRIAAGSFDAVVDVLKSNGAEVKAQGPGRPHVFIDNIPVLLSENPNAAFAA